MTTTNKYIIIGGNYYRAYTGTGTFTSINVVGSTDSEEEVKQIVNDKCNECGGLMLVIDTTTGKEATI